MVLNFWKNSISTAFVLSSALWLVVPLVLSIAILFPSLSKAATKVPTIRIEIPKKDSKTADPNAQTVPTILLSDDDLAPSIDRLIEEENLEDQNIPELTDEAPKKSEPVKVFYGDEELPEPVKALRSKLIDIAKSGEIDKLLPLFESFESPPLVSLEDEENPIEFLKSSSGDGEGREILAILLELLESGYVLRDKNEGAEIYVWPYFVEIPPEDLTPRQIVELFRIITAGDFEDMKAYGTYIFYRIGITANGDMKFFIAGD